jgi:hypothetical protein
MDEIFDNVDGTGIDKFAVIFIIFFVTIFVIIAGGILFAIIHGVRQWNRNNQLPVSTVPASVVTKRGQFSSGTENSSSSTSYYVTFEIRGGERLEFQMLGAQYGQLAEGDHGQLTHQGTRYKGFDRTPQDR